MPGVRDLVERNPGGDPMRRFLTTVAVLTVAWLTLSACLFGQQPPAQAPPIINNITPTTGGGDSGLLVMLTFVGGGAFLLLIALLVVGGLLYNARRNYRDLRDVVRDIADVTGRDFDELTVMSVRRRRALAEALSPQARALLPGAEITRR